ncbi:MAG: GT4 family glycosyltransferase PelF [Thaumarchaeota archaeon]|nr:GT4 family glycosyltransferase PelF [Nitrososphaerota archaeon]
MNKVLLINWDCYPNCTSGGVYTWTKTLIDNMPDWQFTVVNQLSNPNCNGKFIVPENVTRVIEMPIFGSNRYEEFHNDGKSLLKKILDTTEKKIDEVFLPLYREFLGTVLSDDCDPEYLAEIIYKLHKFLSTHDSKKCFEHPKTWEIFLQKITSDLLYQQMTLKDALVAFQLIQRNMQILSITVDKVDIIHCSLAWLPSFIAIFVKKESNCPIIITEHGVAFRELLLYYNGYLYDEPSKIFWKVFSRNVVKTIYSVADLITPVCQANANWEQILGMPQSKIKVIYNGVDTNKFKPMDVPRDAQKYTVVCVARVDVFKDIICLIQAIKYAKESIPNIQCLIYGGSTDLDYSFRCVNAVRDLQLDDTVKFMGGTKEPQKAYNQADVVVISSITEGFPFAVIEAMSCGKAVVASDVGGVKEALQDCGVLVRSRRPHDLANALIRLHKDDSLRDRLGKAATQRAASEFTLLQSVNEFRNQYNSVIESHKRKHEEMIGAVQ